MHLWRRQGKFNTLDTTIDYNNYDDYGLFNTLRVTITAYGKLFITFFPNEIMRDTVHTTLKWYSPYGVYRFNIYTKYDLIQLQIMFLLFNKKNTEIPTDLIIEIEQIFAALHDPDLAKSFQHSIPSDDKPYSYVKHEAPTNPDSKSSSELVHMLYKYHKDKTTLLEQVKWLLVTGEDPNKLDTRSGNTPLYLAVMSESIDLEIIKLLMIYHAHPLNRRTGNCCPSPIDLARRNASSFAHYKLKLQFMLSAVNKLERPTNIKIKDDFFYADGKVTTTFALTNDTSINTIFKKYDELTDEEYFALKKICADYFDVAENFSDTTTLDDVIEDDFIRENAIFDLIKDEHDTIVGFNLYQFIKSAENKYEIGLHWVLTALNRNYRGTVLTSILALRLAYVLQLLNPESIIVFYCSCIVLNSYERVAAVAKLHHPQYQTVPMNKLKNHLMEATLSGDYKFVHDLMTCYITERIRSKVSSKNESAYHLRAIFFKKYLLGNPPVAAKEVRSVPVMFIVGDENFLSLFEISKSMGINFLDHIIKLALFMIPVLSKMNVCDLDSVDCNDKKAINPANVMRSAVMLFYRNQAVPSKKQLPEYFLRARI